MSAELSRRLARVVLLEPIRSLPPADRRAIADAAEDAATFAALPERFQHMVLLAEMNRARLIAARRDPPAAPSRTVPHR
jgi:hypothetical protein